MQITVCGIHAVTYPEGQRLVEADGRDPFILTVNGQEIEISVCEKCRPSIARSLHTMMMASGMPADDTGMTEYLDNQDEEEEEYESEENDDAVITSATAVPKEEKESKTFEATKITDSQADKLAATAMDEIKSKSPSGKRGPSKRTDIDTREVRQWAEENGIKVAKRGAVRQSVIDQYVTAHS